MKKALPSIALLIVVGCTPSVSETPAQPLVTARFDPSQTPPVLPTPNDLALDPTTGLLHVTVPPGAPAADRELADYFNAIQGFPPDSAAFATFSGRLDPTSVTMATVRVIDRTTKTWVSVTPGYADTGDPTAPGRIAVGPIPGGWVAGHDYGIALIGGANGLKGADGQRVAGTPSWALASAKNPLVTCQDLTSPDCKATTDVIPSSANDPVERLADQTQKAIQLEKVRRLVVAPLIENLEALNVDRNDLVLAWSFRVVSFATLVYQPSAIPPQIPMPNDLAIDPKTGKNAVPLDPSTSGHASVTLPGLDPVTVDATTVQVLDTSGAALQVTPTYNAANNVIDIAPPTGGWTQGHRYAVVVVGGPNGVESAIAGQPVIASAVWVLIRSKSSLVTCTDLTSTTCQPTVTLAPLLPADAVKLEKIRLGFAPLLDSFEAKGVPRSEVLVAWTFTVL